MKYKQCRYSAFMIDDIECFNHLGEIDYET